jgi:hypothetical protein
MFRFRRKRPFITVHVEDLQLEDRLVFDNVAVKVVSVRDNGNQTTRVGLESTHPGSPARTRWEDLYNEMLITVAR